MAELETTVIPGSGLPAGTTPLFYRSAANRLVAPAGLTIVTGPADARVYVEAPGDASNGVDVDVTRLPADPLGANADPAVLAGAAGSISAKLRLMSSQLDAIQTSLGQLDNTVGGNELQVDIVSGGLTITRPATSVIASVATSTGSATLKASNNNRLGLIIDNDSDATLYVKFGTTAASATDFSVRVDPRVTYVDQTGYTGEVRGILSTGTGSARVTELTA